MVQTARNVSMIDTGFLQAGDYLIHDRDGKYCAKFVETLEGADIKPVKLPARSPNLNAYAERWVRSVKDECLSKLILFGEGALRRTLSEYLAHYHGERNHQGKDNLILFPAGEPPGTGPVRRKQRLGGLLNYYHREAG